MTKLIDITGKALSGEWGKNDETGVGIPVLRTTNFTNEGVVNYNDVVTRIITKNNIDEKYLRKGDIIIEKSGGSDKYPVGRVIYFDGEENTYLFNNFTGLLRVRNQEVWYPRYVFYSLYSNYLRGGTRAFENKTTGLHNLKTDDYISNFEVAEIDMLEQILICQKLDKLYGIIKMRKQELLLLDNIIKARFNEMFGHISDQVDVGYYIESLTAGKSLAGEAECDNKVLKTGAVSYDYFDLSQVKNLPLDYKPIEEHRVKVGDVIISRMNTSELTGAAAYVWSVDENVFLPDRLWRAEIKDNCLPIFIWQLLIQPSTKEQIKTVASGTSGSMKNISKPGLLGLKVKKVSIEKQKEFVDLVIQVNNSKMSTKQMLGKTQMLFDSLMQEYFG